MPRKKSNSGPPERKKSAKKKRAPAYNSQQLTRHLREIAAECQTIDDEGNLITNGEALASMLWKKALGYHEAKTLADGTEKSVFVPPASWAIQLIYERMEGKAPIAIPDDSKHQSAAAKVDELVRSRINSMSDASVATKDEEVRSVPEDKAAE